MKIKNPRAQQGEEHLASTLPFLAIQTYTSIQRQSLGKGPLVSHGVTDIDGGEKAKALPGGGDAAPGL